MKKTLTLIDTFGFFFRLFYAMRGLKTRSGLASGMVSGFANFLFSLREEGAGGGVAAGGAGVVAGARAAGPVIFALDSKGPSFRSQIYPAYKANRQAPPPELAEQIPVCIELIEKLGLAGVSREGYEADDLIASLVKIASSQGLITRIISQDKDLYQLIKDGTAYIYSPVSKNIYDEAACLEKYGVRPGQIVDFLALCGDSSDNIPGVKGIGAKGAKTLLEGFGSLEGIYENLVAVANERTRSLLAAGREAAFLSQKLARLNADLAGDEDLAWLLGRAGPGPEDFEAVRDLLEKYELRALLKKLPSGGSSGALTANLISGEGGGSGGKGGEGEGGENKPGLDFEPVLILDEGELFGILNGLAEGSVVAFDTETTGLDTRQDRLVGFSFCVGAADKKDGEKSSSPTAKDNKPRAYYVPLAHSYLGVPAQVSMEAARRAVGLIFSHLVLGHNLKFDLQVIQAQLGLAPPARYADTMLLAWLARPGSRVGMDELALRLFAYSTIKLGDLLGRGENFSSLDLARASAYAAEDAFITLKFFEYFKEHLEPDLWELAEKIEFPFIKLIMMMEAGGIGLNSARLGELTKEFSARLGTLAGEIYELCGQAFNLNSPRQVGEMLFERLGLPSQKSGKSGLSTDEAVLKRLTDKHPVVEKILAHRELAKLISTYCEPLLKLAAKDEGSRIYSHFLQHGTATGRLASREPNLQNIPAHGQYARAYKSCFEAGEGCSFLSLDYSQIELRMLAHFSADEGLLGAFAADEDIHARTAIMIFGSCDERNRAVAKGINFGLIYGMGAKSLAENLGLDLKAAKAYIEKYFENFPSVREYFARVKGQARQEGFITTLAGRRRYFDFASARPVMAAAYERESINSILQGSAADLIKLAMLKIAPELNEDQRLILQIHDELIFEARDELLGEFTQLARAAMEGVVDLRVKLRVNTSVAKTWAGLK